MIDGLKPYGEMKDSGVEWLGAVPAYWGVRRLKALLSERGQKGFPDEPLLTATQSKGVVRKDQYENRTVLAMKDLHLLKLVCVGDFVISLRSFQGGIEFARERGIISPAYTVLYPKQPQVHAYLAWLFKSAPFIQGLSLFVTGIRQGQNIDYEKLSRSKVPLPPADEQAAIVRFLDHADRRVRRAIAAKQKLIRLLEEQKRAIIQRAVTRGLAPDVRLKPSGIKWLGDIPSHWGMERLSHVAHFRSGRAHENHVDESGAYFCVNARFVSTDGRSVKRCTENFCPARKADVLMVMSDLPNGRALARAFFTPEDDRYAVNQRVGALTAFGVEPKFLFYFANRNVQLLQHDDGSNQTHLSNYDFKTMRVLVPPVSEQREIVAELDRLVRVSDEESRKAAKEIDLLREYRIRLVTDVVTGKLDVREAVANLLELAEPADSEIDIDEENEVESMEEDAIEDQAA